MGKEKKRKEKVTWGSRCRQVWLQQRRLSSVHGKLKAWLKEKAGLPPTKRHGIGAGVNSGRPSGGCGTLCLRLEVPAQAGRREQDKH